MAHLPHGVCKKGFDLEVFVYHFTSQMSLVSRSSMKL